MATTRKINANKKNAQQSSGPKTIAGKAQSARNALRHGLAVPLFADGQLSAEAERLAIYVADGRTEPRVMDACRRFADAHMTLLRVRKARMTVLEVLLTTSGLSAEHLNGMIEVTRVRPHLAASDKAAARFAELDQKLLSMDRYERRALSQRAVAIRALEVLQIAAMSSA
jgi:hypothetical protein